MNRNNNFQIFNYAKSKRRVFCYFFKFGFRIKVAHLFNRKMYICVESAVHGNMGDQALGYCRKRFLTDYCNIPKNRIIEYTSRDRMKYWKQIKCEHTANDIIILRGGGFWGDLWLDGFQAMLLFIDTFKNYKIIVFPQSVYFTDSENGRIWIEKSQKIIDNVRYLRVFTRDFESQQLLESLYPSLNVKSTPDTVLSFYPGFGDITKRDGILLCLRNDKERKRFWNDDVVNCLKSLDASFFYQDTSIDFTIKRIKEREKKLNELWAKFASANLVITDRLHGMIFATITGTPCIVFDNIDGKVGHEYQWIKNLDYVLFYDGKQNLLDVIKYMLTVKAKQYPIEAMMPLFDSLKNVILEEDE